MESPVNEFWPSAGNHDIPNLLSPHYLRPAHDRSAAIYAQIILAIHCAQGKLKACLENSLGLDRSLVRARKTWPATMEKSKLISGTVREAWPRSRRRRLAFAGVSAVTVSICSLAVGISSSHATCGDWLAHSDNSMTGAKSPAQSTTASDTTHNAPLRRPLSAPCHGPHCRKAPAQPTQSLPSSAQLRYDRLPLVALSNSHEPPERHFRLSYELVVHSSKGFPPRIDHPPRA